MTQPTTTPTDLSPAARGWRLPAGLTPLAPRRFVVLDLETTGLDLRFDQILQAAAVLLDAELQEIDAFAARASLAPWIAPSPTALLITRTRPAELEGGGSPLPLAMDAIADVLARWKAEAVREAAAGAGARDDAGRLRPALLVLGHNLLNFDDEVLRGGLFAALHEPWASTSGGAARGDVLKLARMAHLLAPGAIAVPTVEDEATDEETGAETGGGTGWKAGKTRPSFRLSDLAAANGIALAPEEAHDAMADARAAAALLRLIARRAPEAFALMRGLADRKGLEAALLSGWAEGGPPEPVAELRIEQGVGVARLLLPLAPIPGTSRLAAADLGLDPEAWLGLPEQALAERLGGETPPVVPVTLSRQPALVAFDAAAPDLPPALAARIGALVPGAADPGRAAAGLLAARAARIAAEARRDETWRARMAALAGAALPREETGPEAGTEREPEERLYADGFPSDADRALVGRLRAMAPAQVAAAIPALADARLEAFAWRRAYALDPAALPSAERRRLDLWRLGRLLREDGGWRSLPEAIREAHALLPALCRRALRTPADEQAFDADCLRLREIVDWLERRRRAALQEAAALGVETAIAELADEAARPF